MSVALASLCLHGALFFAVAAGAWRLPQTGTLAPLRFVGQTFDVDALGQPQLSEPTAPGQTPTESAPLPAPSKEPNVDDEVSATVDHPDDARDREEQQDEGETTSEPTPPPTPQPTESPAAASEPSGAGAARDPFDGDQLPGQPTQVMEPTAQTGAYGAKGESAGTIDVYLAFLRHFPQAAKTDPSWETMAPGPAGRIELLITLDKDKRGLVVNVQENEHTPTADHLKRAVLVTRNFLGTSQLAWDANTLEGTQRLALTAHVERRPVAAQAPYARGIQAFGVYGEQRPTGAFFRYFSGQHIEIELLRLP